MSKLIGTNPNQVPSNADLGTAAFMDKKDFLLSKGSEMSAIDAIIPKTAVDVFVYDTSKDSDGGAWRKRTQHTSWYNERLNTTTRGKRKEFPSVAVIVAEVDTVTIYDGDDPDMPMWMTFPVNNSSWLKHSGSGGCKAVVARNGIMVTGGDLRGAIVRFIADDGNTFEAGYNYEHRTITTRNTSVGPATGTIRIVNNAVNDVAMTVLPKAPIDPDTGLPVPTIAVATATGVSVIKDDGTVVDITQSTIYNTVLEIDFTSDNKIIYTMDNAASRSVRVDSIPSADFTVTTNQLSKGNGEEFYTGSDFGYYNGNLAINLPSGSVTEVVGANLNERVLSMPRGITKIAANPAGPSTGLTNFIASDYNTGWMNGDIKLATLSDTDTTNAVGTELLTGWVNGSTYAYDTLSTSGATISSAITNGSNFAGAVSNAMSLTAGKQYTASFALTINSGAALTYVLFVQDQSGGGSLGLGKHLLNIGTGNHCFTFTAPSTGTFYLLLQAGNGVTTNFTTGAVSVRLAESDRSYNDKGVQVFGTVTKTAVATGTDLVGYSGFSSASGGNFLRKPYDSGLDLGTGDFVFSIWCKLTAASAQYDFLWEAQTFNNSSRFYIIRNVSTGNLYLPYNTDTANTFIPLGVWTKVDIVRQSNVASQYINGIKAGISYTSNQNLNASSASGDATFTHIGCYNGGLHGWNGSIALARISATAPTAEQIKKMYNDEKVLFQENAKATLYGTSDEVTALAYDDDTELLHAGTSTGRSDFQGLRRINNTTRAIGTAISAVDGFVVEE